ncbi:MAG: carboxypeptidase-like regulatory domain-containing protein, partial [Candidatus Marinimicrobia bacterium]|nr:carboxypeptidase-like regulatory domain-containing protein [Candidatus Neomarinimicrobiota bacterium]
MKKFIYHNLPLFFFCSFSMSQNISVSGIVINDQTQSPLSNVNIVFNNSGTVTDQNGKFKFFTNVGDSLSFSHIGYKSVKIEARANLVLLMHPYSLIGSCIDVSAYRDIS